MNTHRRRQLVAVYSALRNGRWWTLQALCEHAERQGAPSMLTGISARVRDLRKDRFGRHRIDKRRVRGSASLYEYRMVGK